MNLALNTLNLGAFCKLFKVNISFLILKRRATEKL